MVLSSSHVLNPLLSQLKFHDQPPCLLAWHTASSPWSLSHFAIVTWLTIIHLCSLCTCPRAAECARMILHHHIGCLTQLMSTNPAGAAWQAYHVSTVHSFPTLLGYYCILYTCFSHIHVSYSQPLPFSLIRNDQMRTSMCFHYHTYHLPVSVLLAPSVWHSIYISVDLFKDVALLNFPSLSYSISFFHWIPTGIQVIIFPIK